VFECATSEGLGLDYAMMEFNAPAPPSVVEDGPYATIGYPSMIILGLLK